MVGKVNVGKSALFEAVFPKGRNQEPVSVKAVRDKEKRDSERSTIAEEEHGTVQRARAFSKNDDTLFANSPGELAEPLPEPPSTAIYNPNAINEDEMNLTSEAMSQYAKDLASQATDHDDMSLANEAIVEEQ